MTIKTECLTLTLTLNPRRKEAQGSPEAADRYWEARRAAASAVAEAKTPVWEEFGEAMDKVGVEEVLANRSTTQEGRAGLD